MAKPARVPATFVRSDDETYILTITSDTAGLVPVDLTGRTYVMSIAMTAGATPVTSATGSVDGPNGEVTFSFPEAKTVLLTGSQYDYDIVETASGAESTLVLSTLSVLTGVTA